VVIDFVSKYPEVRPLTVNLIMLAVAGAKGEWGKATYWLGACILTVGILMMKG
jgi:hypothetical protein